MHSQIHHKFKFLAATLAGGAILAPAAPASIGFIPGPPTVEPTQTHVVDLRSPDAQDAGLAAQRSRQSSTVVDLRSPDTRDAALSATQARATNGPVTRVVHVSDHSGVDWSDVGVVASGALTLLLIGVGGMLAISRRRARVTHGSAFPTT